jgi:hypothetical protein
MLRRANTVFGFALISLASLASLAPSAAWAEEPAPPGPATAPPPAPATIAPPSPATAPPGDPAAAAPAVTVELRANDPRATLERRQSTTTVGGLGLPDLGIGGLTQWESACVAPCTAAPVSTDYSYRISGDGLVPSKTFTLPRGPRTLRIDADLGSSTGRVTGMVLTAGGAGALLLGGAALVASPILSANDVGSEGFRTGVLAGGAGGVGLGVLLAAAGLTLWLSNGSTLRFDPSPALASAPRPRPQAAVRLLPTGLAF